MNHLRKPESGWYWLTTETLLKFAVDHRSWLTPVLLTVVAMAPYYGQGLATTGDNLLHLYRLVALDHNLAEGILYPRWLSELFLGLGYPTLSYYAPSTYYLAALIHHLGVEYSAALIWTMAVLVLIAALGMHQLACDFFAAESTAAPVLVATSAYLFAPYLLNNIHVRGAIAELGAQALFPWILWSFRRLIKAEQSRPYLWWAALSLSALAFTHTISLFLIALLLPGYVLALHWTAHGFQRASWSKLVWSVASVTAAAGISAVFWLPLAGERQFLSRTLYEQTASHLYEHLRTWPTFFDYHWPFSYPESNPFRLNLLQMGFAVAGAGLSRRRNAEWMFWVGSTLLAAFFLSARSAPIWLSSELLLSVQFPWRLLAILSLPFALFTGQLVAYSRQPGIQRVSACLVIVLIVYAHYPRLAGLARLPLDDPHTNLTSISQYEAITGRFGLSTLTLREMMPRWVHTFNFELPPRQTGPSTVQDITLHAAGPQTIALDITTPVATALRFSNLYFPGWRAQLEDGLALTTYPSTDLGLLTVNLPAGRHQIKVLWSGTALQNWGMVLSLCTLFMLVLFYVSRSSGRHFAIGPLALLVLGFAVSIRPPAAANDFQAAPSLSPAQGLKLLGYRARQETPELLYLFPYWYVSTRLPELRMEWRLRDSTGREVARCVMHPYFNALRTYDWPAGTLVDDAYALPLPPGLHAGAYTLQVRPVPTDADVANPVLSATESFTVGTVLLTQPVPPSPQPTQPLDRWLRPPGTDNQIFLHGYDVAVAHSFGDRRRSHAPIAYPVLGPGEAIDYTLYWQATQPIPDGYQVFVQLLDHQQQVMVQTNQPLAIEPGPPYFIWDPFYVRRTTYRLQLPADAHRGLYTPSIGLYQLKSGERFPTYDSDGKQLGDAVTLPPVKVINDEPIALAHPLAVKFGEIIALKGFAIQPDSAVLRAPTTLTLTVAYESLATTPVDYTQFVHLFDPRLGMATQLDTQPQAGGDPTSTWLPGETVIETLPLSVPAHTQPGRYALRIGFYDAQGNGKRLPVYNQQGQPRAEDHVVLMEFEIK